MYLFIFFQILLFKHPLIMYVLFAIMCMLSLFYLPCNSVHIAPLRSAHLSFRGSMRVSESHSNNQKSLASHSDDYLSQ